MENGKQDAIPFVKFLQYLSFRKTRPSVSFHNDEQISSGGACSLYTCNTFQLLSLL